MPDRPESPEERLRTALREIRGIARTFVEDARVRERIDRIARAALSTPAGPSPEPTDGSESSLAKVTLAQFMATGDGAFLDNAQADTLREMIRVLIEAAAVARARRAAATAAPSPREEAVEADRVYWIVACAECGEQYQLHHARNGVDPCGCFGAHPPKVITVPLSAARPSSPTPEETP